MVAGIMPTPVSEFDYALPEELIAQRPAEPRDSSRLLRLDRQTGEVVHGVFGDIVGELHAGDVLVFNATKVFKARLLNANRSAEMFVLKIGEGTAEVFLRPGKRFPVRSRVRIGSDIVLSESPAFREFEVVKKERDGVVYVKTGMTAQEMFAFCEEHGEIPTPPYVDAKDITDTQYQTVYAKESGSVAAPTAGLHFTPEIIERLRAKGVQIEEVILHVGMGTFRPVQSEFIEDHVMHAETVELTAGVADRLNQAKREGRRIIAVGTTTTRVLEGVAMFVETARRAVSEDEKKATQGELAAFTGDLNIFITPGFTFKVIDGLLTNFHLPKSTLLMLVSAFAGKEHVLAAYKKAVEQKYRFFSFGDAMLIL